jgi:hypothetical protein
MSERHQGIKPILLGYTDLKPPLGGLGVKAPLGVKIEGGLYFDTATPTKESAVP